MAGVYSRSQAGIRFSAFFVVFFCMAAGSYGQLSPDYYNSSCPNLENVVFNSMRQAVRKDYRMAASILRMFFHDCFVQGCDGSVLLDDTPTFQGEKTAFPNNNSLRGFEVIDTIKSDVEGACKGVVSCADILALAARDGVILSGGPNWRVPLGRRDARTASLVGANTDIPSPLGDVTTLISNFQAKGLSVQDMVTLSGAHTIGLAKCLLFRSRLYNQTGDGQPDSTLDTFYLSYLKTRCPSSPGVGDDNRFALDAFSPFYFDNQYYINLVNKRGLLTSDQELFSTSGNETVSIVQDYSQNIQKFFSNFGTSMIKMGNINPLTGSDGEIRQNCRALN